MKYLHKYGILILQPRLNNNKGVKTMKTINELLNDLFDAIEVAKERNKSTNLPWREDPEILKIQEQIEALVTNDK